MQIQINTDNNVSLSQELRDWLSATITKELSRYDDHITRVELHLADENASKQGVNDKRCMIEVRPGGMQPIAVTDHSDTWEMAVSGAVKKLLATLEKAIGRLSKN